jgi:hypothetical protein
MRYLAAFKARAAFLPLLYFLRGKRFDFTNFHGFARSRYPATAYGFRALFLFGQQIAKFSLFLAHRAIRPPEGFVGWALPTNHLTRLLMLMNTH